MTASVISITLGEEGNPDRSPKVCRECEWEWARANDPFRNLPDNFPLPWRAGGGVRPRE